MDKHNEGQFGNFTLIFEGPSFTTFSLNLIYLCTIYSWAEFLYKTFIFSKLVQDPQTRATVALDCSYCCIVENVYTVLLDSILKGFLSLL